MLTTSIWISFDRPNICVRDPLEVIKTNFLRYSFASRKRTNPLDFGELRIRELDPGICAGMVVYIFLKYSILYIFFNTIHLKFESDNQSCKYSQLRAFVDRLE